MPSGYRNVKTSKEPDPPHSFKKLPENPIDVKKRAREREEIERKGKKK